MSEKDGHNLTPVILGHAPCTGGSMIYRILMATFGWSGLSEIGVAKELRVNRYNPWDPEYQLFMRNEISAEQFGEIIFQRTVACEKLAAESGKRLLIREHTHSFLFDPVDEQVVPEGGSWFVDMYRKRRDLTVPCLISIRDPVDSWLGMRRSFDNLAPDDFDTYCRLYNEMLDKIDRANSSAGRYLIFRYEDMLEDPQKVIDQISDHVGEDRRFVDLSTVGKLVGSGNSGRISNQLKARRRRPFTAGFIGQTERSEQYRILCRRMKYPTLAESMTFSGTIRSRFYSMISIWSRLISSIEYSAGSLRSMLRSGKNIQ